MRALTYHGVHDIRYGTAPDAALVAPTDAIVRMRRAAICGSDLHVVHGRERGLDTGTVMGHELMGTVEAIGSGVARARVGDRVVSPFTTSCGACFYCARGLSARCVAGELFGWVTGGRGLHGAQSEWVRVPLADATLIPVPDDVEDDAAVLLADVLPTGLFCARNAELAPGDTAVVLGCGPVGLMAVAAAVDRGAGRVFAVDAVAERRAWAKRFGATALAPGDGTVADVVHAATEGRGADAVLEVVGSAEAGRAAFGLVRPGGVVSMVGVHHEPHLAFGPAEAYDRNLTLRVGRCPARSLADEALALLRRRPELASIVTHRRPLADGVDAYAQFDAKRDGCIKLVLEP